MQVVAQSGELTGGAKATVTTTERIAPNGKKAVMYDGLWAGYLNEESTSGRGMCKVMHLFDVIEEKGTLIARPVRDCVGKMKRELGKRVHGLQDIASFSARCDNGEMCCLYTEK